MASETADKIKSGCNIVDVIGKEVKLKREGANYSGLCPFHGEKTPSFKVSEQKQFFKCFGCGESGDVIAFVMKYYHLDFMEAVKKLADEYSIAIDEGSFRKGISKAKYYDLTKKVAKQFVTNLFSGSGSSAKAYLLKRGVDEQTMVKFGMGFALNDWANILNSLEDGEKATALQLGIIGSKQNRSYDKFVNRVIFPIIDLNRHVIGFGGRTLTEDKGPKYLNSSDSVIFHKKDHLYGLNIAADNIRKKDRAVLVEGYMDVVSVHQAGIDEAVASLGTALTEEQVKLLKRFTRNIVLSYDSDAAGKQATFRAIQRIVKQGLSPRVVDLGAYKDPDELITEEGRDAYLAKLDNSIAYIDFVMDYIEGMHDDSLQGKRDAKEDIIEFLTVADDMEIAEIGKKISERFNIDEDSLISKVRNAKRNVNHPRRENANKGASERMQNRKKKYVEAGAIALCMSGKKYLGKIVSSSMNFFTENGYHILEVLTKFNDSYDGSGDYKEDLLAACSVLPQEDYEYLQKVIDNIKIGDPEVFWEHLKIQAALFILEDKHREYMLELELLEGDKSKAYDEKAREINIKLASITKDRNKLIAIAKGYINN